jgi:hypothetical protein
MHVRAFRTMSAVVTLVVAMVVPVVVMDGTPAVAASGVLTPAHDPFYRYTGKTPLAKIAHGTALKERSVTLGLATTGTPLPAEQILYRTTDAVGNPAISVTTVVMPLTGTVVPKVAAYLSFYDALTSLCDPSYTEQGGDPGTLNGSTADIEQALVEALRTSGDIVTIPDFEDERLDYVAGTESGMSTLDSIAATLSVLDLSNATPIGLMGYSGGSIAADWASELAPGYAPHLNIVGTAMGGIPVDLAHNLRYINGSAAWSDVIPASMIGITRSFHIDFGKYLSRYGKKIVAAESHECIGQFMGAYPNLTLKQLLKPRYADVYRVPIFSSTLNKLIMGSAPGHPEEPMLMVAGNVDGTGDGVMVERDEQQLAYEYCHQGVAVDFEQLKQLNHDGAGAAFFPQGIAYLQTRFAGIAPQSDCSSIQRGNALRPLK